MSRDTDDTPGTFSTAEKEAMRARAEEIRAEKAQGRGAKKRESDRTKLEELIGGLPEGDRRDAQRVHEVVALVAPQLDPRTWYGMPAWALDGEVLCFFTPSSKFDERYSSFGFNAAARLDEGSMWPTAFAVAEVDDCRRCGRLGSFDSGQSHAPFTLSRDDTGRAANSVTSVHIR